MQRRVRAVALVAAAVLLAGCSDPMGAARRIAAESHSATPTPTAHATKATHPAKAKHWVQALHSTQLNRAAGLRVRATALRGDHAVITITDLKANAVKRVHADVTPQSVVVGRYAITGIVISANKVTFSYALK